MMAANLELAASCDSFRVVPCALARPLRANEQKASEQGLHDFIDFGKLLLELIA
jgi:hypothetical protein